MLQKLQKCLLFIYQDEPGWKIEEPDPSMKIPQIKIEQENVQEIDGQVFCCNLDQIKLDSVFFIWESGDMYTNPVIWVPRYIG